MGRFDALKGFLPPETIASMEDEVLKFDSFEGKVPAVHWRPEAPENKMKGLTHKEFYGAHALAMELLDEGYPFVEMVVDPRYATGSFVFDSGGPAEETFNNVMTVGLRPGETDSEYDMSRILVTNQFNGDPHTITFADGAHWVNPIIKGYRMNLVGTSTTSSGIYVKQASLGFFGGRQELFTNDAAAAPLVLCVGGFGGMFNSGENIWSHMLGREGFTCLSPVFDIAGSFCWIEPGAKGVTSDSVTNSGAPSGFVKWIAQQSDCNTSYEHTGLATTAQEVLNWDGVRTRPGAQPGRPIFELDISFSPYSPSTAYGRTEYGYTFMVDTTGGDVTINMPPAAIAKGESLHIVNESGTNKVILNPGAGEACDIADIAPGQSVILESDGSATLGSAGRWLLTSTSLGPETLGREVVYTAAPDSPASGAVDISTPLTKLDVNVNNTYSLADGSYEGQVKDLVVATVTSAGTAVLTPANFADGATISVTAVGQSCSLKWLSGNWHLLSAVGAVIA